MQNLSVSWVWWFDLCQSCLRFWQKATPSNQLSKWHNPRHWDLRRARMEVESIFGGGQLRKCPLSIIIPQKHDTIKKTWAPPQVSENQHTINPKNISYSARRVTLLVDRANSFPCDHCSIQWGSLSSMTQKWFLLFCDVRNIIPSRTCSIMHVWFSSIMLENLFFAFLVMGVTLIVFMCVSSRCDVFIVMCIIHLDEIWVPVWELAHLD